MAAKLSTALVNMMMGIASFKDALANCVIDIYSGSQPTDADTAASGTLLVTLSKGSGATTAETKSSGTFKLASGSAGSVDTVTVNSIDILGGAVPYNTSLGQTAIDVAAQINRNNKNKMFTAAASGNNVVITAIPGLGTLPNTWVVDGSTTTLVEDTHVNMAGGVDAVNGLNFDDPASGAISKRSSETWSGVAAATGTAGWFRIRQIGDGNLTDSTGAWPRYDGAIATSGAQMNLGSLTVTAAATFTLSGGTITLPKA